MTEKPIDPGVLAYIEANRGRYTREALTRMLVAAGNDPAEIERAWAVAEAKGPPGDAGTAPASPWAAAPIPPVKTGLERGVARSPLFWLVFGGYLVALYGGPILLTIVAPTASTVQFVWFVAMVVGGLVGWAVWREKRPEIGMGLGWGLLVGVLVPFVALVALLGLCIAGLITV